VRTRQCGTCRYLTRWREYDSSTLARDDYPGNLRRIQYLPADTAAVSP
jgi:hypothetical protein